MTATEAQPHSSTARTWSLLAAVPPATIAIIYMTMGPGGHSSRTQFVAAFLTLLVGTAVAGAAAPSVHVRFASMVVALTGILALGGAAAPSFGLYLDIGAIPAGVAAVKLWRAMAPWQAGGIFLAAALTTAALFAAGLEMTHL